MSRIARFLRRLAQENIQVETRRVPAVSMLFYDDGTSEIMSRQGYEMTLDQHKALKEFLQDQALMAMDRAVKEFERIRQRAERRLLDDRVVPFHTSHEIN